MLLYNRNQPIDVQLKSSDWFLCYVKINLKWVLIYLFKVSNGKIRTICEIYSKVTIKTPVSFWYVYYIWTDFIPFSGVSVVDFFPVVELTVEILKCMPGNIGGQNGKVHNTKFFQLVQFCEMVLKNLFIKVIFLIAL